MDIKIYTYEVYKKPTFEQKTHKGLKYRDGQHFAIEMKTKQNKGQE